MKFSDTIIPRSDQLNGDDLVGRGRVIIKITRVKLVESKDQPAIVEFEGCNGRPYKPNKTMRKIMHALWGDDHEQWNGRYMQLYFNPDITFGGKKDGGIEFDGLSHIESKRTELTLVVGRGKKRTFTISRIEGEHKAVEIPAQKREPDNNPAITEADLTSAREQLATAAPFGMSTLQKCWAGLSAEIRTALGGSCPQEYKDIANAPPPVVEAEPQPADDDDGMF